MTPLVAVRRRIRRPSAVGSRPQSYTVRRRVPPAVGCRTPSDPPNDRRRTHTPVRTSGTSAATAPPAAAATAPATVAGHVPAPLSGFRSGADLVTGEFWARPHQAATVAGESDARNREPGCVLSLGPFIGAETAGISPQPERACPGMRIDVAAGIDSVSLPAGLLSFFSGDKFNESIDNVCLPAGLRCLTFGDSFNQSIINVSLPADLRSLTFGHCFNQCMDNVSLPVDLQSFTFGWHFNQSIERVSLSASLRSLTLGEGFNQPIDNVTLPDGLLSFSFGYHFNQSIEKVALPSGLLTLKFGDNFN